MARPGTLTRPAESPNVPQSHAWAQAPLVALIMIAIIAVRLHEFVPRLELLKPALLATAIGLTLLWSHSPAGTRARVLRTPLVWVVFAYWLFMVVTIPFALWPGQAFRSAQNFLPAVALLSAILLCSWDDRTALKLHVGFVAAAAAYALYVKTFGRVSFGRLDAGLGMYDSNEMAALLGIVVPLAVGMARRTKGMTRSGLYAAVVLMVLVTLASGSRGGLLGMAAGAVVLAFGMKGSRRIKALAVFALAFGAIWLYSPGFKQRMMTLTNLEYDYNTFDEFGRKQVWARGRQYFAESPVIGIGAGNFPIAEGNYFGILYAGARGAKWSNAHNSYLQAFSELGVIGGTLFVVILLMCAHRALRLWRGVRLRSGALLHRPEYLASLGAFMVSGIFLSHAYFMPLFALAGLIELAELNRRALLRMRPVGLDAPPPDDETALPAHVTVGRSRLRPMHRFRGGLA
jgi:O-antigen ligase